MRLPGHSVRPDVRGGRSLLAQTGLSLPISLFLCRFTISLTVVSLRCPTARPRAAARNLLRSSASPPRGVCPIGGPWPVPEFPPPGLRHGDPAPHTLPQEVVLELGYAKNRSPEPLRNDRLREYRSLPGVSSGFQVALQQRACVSGGRRLSCSCSQRFRDDGSPQSPVTIFRCLSRYGYLTKHVEFSEL